MDLIRKDSKISTEKMAIALGVSSKTIKRHIKEMDNERHSYITGFSNDNILDMAKYLSEIKKPVWIRHVLVPQLSDFDEDLDKLSEFIDTLDNVERVEVLPYHTLGIPYSLNGVCPPDKERISNANKKLKTSMYK